jgi:hypothetical protein
MKKRIFSAAAIVALLLMSGCATQFGTNFDRAKVTAYQPGVTTMDQAMAEVGKPRRERTFTVKKDLAKKELASPVVVREVTLYYEDRQAAGVQPDVQPSRSGWLQFSNNKVLAYVTRSSFKADSTDFDETQVKQLVKGKSTEADVEKLFGPPSGAGIYPVAKDPDGSALNYEIFTFDRKTRKSTLKRLTVFLNASRVVTDYDLYISTK